jgi:hypothetical protein
MWPCGVITLLNELFISESKSQVYGQLHDYLRIAPLTAQNLSTYVVISGTCEPSRVWILYWPRKSIVQQTTLIIFVSNGSLYIYYRIYHL